MAIGATLQEKHLGIPTWGWLGIGAAGMLYVLMGRKKPAAETQPPGTVTVLGGNSTVTGPPPTPPIGPPPPPGSGSFDCSTFPLLLRPICDVYAHLTRPANVNGQLMNFAPGNTTQPWFSYFEGLNPKQQRDFIWYAEHGQFGATAPPWYTSDMAG